MDSRDVYNLYSAYRSVYEDRESLNEDVDYELEEELTGERARRAAKIGGIAYRQGDMRKKHATDRLLYPSNDQTSFGSGNKATRRQGYVPSDTSNRPYQDEWRSEHNAARGVKKKRGFKTGPQFQEEVDLYDVVLDHLLDEGYCDDVESAEVIMANMSEEWVDEIVEGYKPLPIASMLKQASRHGENAGRAVDDLTPSLKRARRVGRMMITAEDHSSEKSQAKSTENFRRGAARRA